MEGTCEHNEDKILVSGHNLPRFALGPSRPLTAKLGSGIEEYTEMGFVGRGCFDIEDGNNVFSVRRHIEVWWPAEVGEALFGPNPGSV
jgi:hypothetical protein